MSFSPNANGPRGFDVAKGRDGTPQRCTIHRILGTYGSKIHTGAPVTLAADGTVQLLSAANDPILGVFNGCEYVEVNGDIKFSPYWPAPGAVKAGTTPTCRIYPAEGLFLIHASASLAQAKVGEFADLIALSGGDDVTGRADSVQMDAVNTDATVQTTNVVQIVEVSPREEGGNGAPATLAVVQFIRPQFAANVA